MTSKMTYDETVSLILGVSAHPDARRCTPDERQIKARIARAWSHYRRGSAILLTASAAERGYIVPITSAVAHDSVRAQAAQEREFGLRTCRRAVCVWRTLLRRLRVIAPIEVWRSVAYAMPATPTGVD